MNIALLRKSLMKRKTAITAILLCGLSLSLSVYPGHNAAPLVTRAALGRMLFNEKNLSRDSSISCASCHRPEYGFADTLPFSPGIGGKLTKRNTPSVLNMKFRPLFFWDGRAGSLEAQALMPIQNPDEMDLPIADAIARLNADIRYTKLFRSVFAQAPNAKNMAAAFAAYERTLETTGSRFDDWSNNLRRLSAAEERGRQLFTGDKAKCFDCHFREDFTADEFRNIGLFNARDLNDSGRFLITGNPADIGRFKTPGLRNVSVTAPYMHNGMFKTLEEVVDYYNDPASIVPGSINADPLVQQPLHLTPQEKKDLVAFLKTLTDKRFLPRAVKKKK